jgi:hypothetical protein
MVTPPLEPTRRNYHADGESEQEFANRIANALEAPIFSKVQEGLAFIDGRRRQRPVAKIGRIPLKLAANTTIN